MNAKTIENHRQYITRSIFSTATGPQYPDNPRLVMFDTAAKTNMAAIRRYSTFV